MGRINLRINQSIGAILRSSYNVRCSRNVTRLYLAKVLHGMGKLRIPREVEIAGLDYEMMESAKKDEKVVSSSTR